MPELNKNLASFITCKHLNVHIVTNKLTPHSILECHKSKSELRKYGRQCDRSNAIYYLFSICKCFKALINNYFITQVTVESR